jgi:CheY-like chemotaxis protein
MAYEDGWEIDEAGLEWTWDADSVVEPDGELHALFIGRDPGIAGLYQLRLELDGYRTVLGTLNGQGVIVGGPPAPDLIYLDLTASESWGLEVLRTIRKDPATRMTPVLLLITVPLAAQEPLGPNVFPVHFGGNSRRDLRTGSAWDIGPVAVAHEPRLLR